MKLNSFFNKSNKQSRNTPRTISFVNETQENAWKDKVEKLQAEIDRLHTVDVERAEYSQRMQAAEIQLHEIKEREVALKAKQALLEEEVKQSDALRETNQELSNDIRDLIGELGLKNSSLEQAANNNLDLNKHVDKLEEQIVESSQRESELKIGLEESIQRSAANKHELQETKSKFSEIEVKLLKIVGNYDNLKTDYDKLTMVAEYWRKVSETLQAENDDLDKTSEILTQLQKDVKVERTQQKGVSKIQKNEITKLEGKLTAMTEALEHLTYKNRYLLTLVSSLRKEAAKPRYLSMGSIAQKEGFKMPFGSENIRKQFLGTSAPTLLKFKVKEDRNDN